MYYDDDDDDDDVLTLYIQAQKAWHIHIFLGRVKGFFFWFCSKIVSLSNYIGSNLVLLPYSLPLLSGAFYSRVLAFHSVTHSHADRSSSLSSWENHRVKVLNSKNIEQKKNYLWG